MLPVKPTLPLAASPVPSVPFEPRTLEWGWFAGLVLLIIVIYIIRYLASNRKTHQYITHTNDDEGSSSTGTPDVKP